jgi:DNA-binding transcriptional ArsR family regulator
MPPEERPGEGGERRLRADVDYAYLELAMRALASPTRLALLGLLTRPHYLEEVAAALKMTRQAVRKHLDQLVAVGILERRPATRESGPVTEYLLNPRALFLIHDEFGKLGALQAREARQDLTRTLQGKPLATVVQPPDVLGPRLLVVRGFATGAAIPLPVSRGLWSIGRDLRCDVVLDHDPYASNRHAEVRYDKGAQGYVLTDLRSTNGTSHNHSVLPRAGEVLLRDGDLIGVGRTTLLFWERAR